MASTETGLTYTNMHQLSLIDILSGGFEYESNYQQATPSGNYFWYRKRLQFADIIIKNIDLFRGLSQDNQRFRCLDIGCGSGVDLLLIRQLLKPHLVDPEYIGFDGSPVNHEVSQLRKKYFDLEDTRFEIIDLMVKLPLDNNSVDFVYCSEVVEHLLEPEKLFKEIRRVLKPKGIFILTTPNEPNIFQRAFWFSSARLSLNKQIQELRDKPEIFKINGKEIYTYGHISCHQNMEWDKILKQEELSLIDYRRGAILYGGTEFHDRNFILGLRFLLEAFLDLLPKKLTRNFSGQLIALYQLLE